MTLSAVPLPSERERIGDPRIVGFQDEPSEEHVEQSSGALGRVADLVSMAGPESATPLQVRFCHVRLPPRLPFRLYGFNLQRVDEAGEIPDDPIGGEGVLYALIVNQPVELQREAAMKFLNDLVARQALVGDVKAERRSLTDLPTLADAADQAAAEESSDTLRQSLSYAATELRTRAASLGYRLEVSYQIDPLPRRQDVARRVPLLRQLYNEHEDVHAAVDGTVSTIGGRPGRLGGSTEEIRSFAQQTTSVLGVRKYMNQVIRDADVCGNGYLQAAFVGLDPSLRCLRPESVVVEAEERYSMVDSGERLKRVTHLRSLEQFGSPYGISPWEVVLSSIQERRVINSVHQLIELERRQHQGTATDEQTGRLALMAEALDRSSKARADELFWFARKRLGQVDADLYFAGQEHMH